jgi:hypothetical protein
MVVRRQNVKPVKKGSARGINEIARKAVGGSWKKRNRAEIPQDHPFSCVRCTRTFPCEADLATHLAKDHRSARS